MAKKDFFVIAQNIRSLYNVGAIFRTADAFGVTKIFLTGYTGTPKNPRLAPYINFDSCIVPIRHRLNMPYRGYQPQNNLIPSGLLDKKNYQSCITGLAKTALGAEKLVFWEHFPRLADLLKKLRREGVRLVALENNVKKSTQLQHFRPRFPLALLLGEEIAGIKSKYLKMCDQVIEIPMQGQKESLNVSVAFGIAAHYIQSQGH